MNKVFLIGRLTKKPELRYTMSNMAVATFTIAVNRPKRQNKEQEADFINVVSWGKQADNCNKYLEKGSQVAIDGRIQTRSYDGEDGKRRYVTEVVADNVQFLNSKKEGKDINVATKQEEIEEPKTDVFADFGKQVEADLEYDSDLPF